MSQKPNTELKLCPCFNGGNGMFGKELKKRNLHTFKTFCVKLHKNH